MATVKFLDNILSKDYKTFSVDEGTSIEKIIRENADESVYESTLIECYDLETGKTYYAPIEDDKDSLNAVILVNDKNVSLDYKVQKNDIVEIVITPAGDNWSWLGAVTGFFTGLFTGAKYLGGFWGAIFGGIVGFFAGGIIGGVIKDSLKIDENATSNKGLDSEKLPDVRGATNQPITDQAFPMVLGKHLTVPFVIGSPFNDISGAHGEENYISVLYAVGYGPLRITDLKLGEQYIAHNKRWAGNQYMKNIWSGTLSGIDEGNNHYPMEYFQQNTDIPLSSRPQITASEMIAAGWDVPDDDSIYTIYSSSYTKYRSLSQTETKTILVTPILADGTVYSPAQLETYADQILSGQTSQASNILLNTFTGDDSVEKAEAYAEELHCAQASFYGLMGDITNIWKNNDVTIEILQQSPDLPVEYGAIYPYAKLQNDIKANVLFIADGTLEEIDAGNNISYKGLGLQNGLRNNPIYFSEQFAKSVKVELDFSQGLYKTRSETVDKTSDVHYYKIPMWVAIQWRVFSEDNDKVDGGNAGTIALPNYNYNTHKYDLIDGKAKRGWNTFEEINPVNVGWTEDEKPCINLYYEFSYNSETPRSGGSGSPYVSYSQTLTLKYLSTPVELDSDFTVKVEYKEGDNSVYKTYTFPANTTRMDINEVVTGPNIQRYIGVRIISLSPNYGGGSGTSSTAGYRTDVRYHNKIYVPLTICVGNGILSSLYTPTMRSADFAAHTGNELPANLNDGWLNQNVFNLEPLGGDDEDTTGINEFRCITEVDFVAWAEENLRAAGDSDEEFVNKFKSYFYDSSNTTKSIEVRVVRVSPNYIDESVSTNEHSAFKFNDIFTWTTLTSTMLDGDELLKSENSQIVQKRPLSEEDMRKLCVIALKAKTDNVDQLSSTIRKFSCVAETFNPYYDKEQKKWFPENVVKKNKYVQLVTINGKKQYQDITEEQYYAERQAGNKNAKCLPGGNDFVEQIVRYVIDLPSHRDSTGRIFIPYKDMENGVYKTGCDGSLNYCNNNVASVFLYAGIGPHLGNDALGYSQYNYEVNGIGDYNMSSLSKWFLWAEKRTDGSTYTYAGYHYDHDGNTVPHEAGDIVEVYFTANAYVYQTELLESILANIAIAGQAIYTRDNKNRLLVVIDKTEKYPVALINQKNILKSSFSINFAQLPSGIQVTFPDEDDGYEQNQIYRMADGEDEKHPLGAIEPYGFKYVTNNNQIWFLSGYMLANRILNKEGVQIQLGMEGSTFSLGDVILLQLDTMLIGTDHGGRITQLIEDDNYIYGFVINDVYHLDGRENLGCVVMQPTKFQEYRVVTLRIASVGTEKVVDGVTYKAVKGKTNTVLFETNISKAQFDPNGNDFYAIKPEVNNLVSFGTIGKTTSPYRIVKIKPSDKQKYDFTLLAYNDDLYNCGQALPSFQNNMTLPDRSAENNYPLSNNVTQSQLVQAIQESADQAKGMVDEMLGSTPSVPSSLALTVDRDRLHFSCVVNTDDINNIDYVEYQIKRKNNTTITVQGTYTGSYVFNRSVDGYPEREDLSDWTIKAKAVSIFTDEHGDRIESDWSSEVNISTASLNAYGTWIPATPSFTSKIPSEGGIQFNWSSATGSNSRTLYGTPKYTVTVLYTDAEHSISERTFATIRSNTLTVSYEFNRNSNYDGYPEVNATNDYKGLNKYTFKLKVENESGASNERESTASGFTQSELNAYGTWIPAAPVLKYANAEENGIDIKWNASVGLNGRTLYGGTTYKAYIVYDNNGTEQSRGVITSDGFTGYYSFDRTTDLYPEKSGTSGAIVTLDNYIIRLEGISTITNRSTVGTDNSVNESNYLTWIPSAPVVTKSLAEEKGISFEWNDPSVCYGTNYYRISLTGAHGTVPLSVASKMFTYYFDRDSDGYPEKSDFNNWKITITAVNSQSNKYTTGSQTSIDTSLYLTWIPPNITVNTEVVDRTVILTALYNANMKFYGNTKTLVKIKRIGNYDTLSSESQTIFNDLLGIIEDSRYYLPEFEKNVQTVSNADNEPNYRKHYPEVTTVPQNPLEGDIILYVGTTESGFINGQYYEYDGTDWVQINDAFESVGYKVTHTLPLLGQTWRIFKEGNVFTGTFTKDVSDEVVVPVNPESGTIIHYIGNETTQGSITFQNGFYYLFENNAWQQVFSKTLIVPTTYYYTIQITNESGNVSNLVEDVEVTALCTNIADVVHSHEYYKDLYVEKLSAINANLGLISQGGLGEFADWKNFWALSDLSAEDSGIAGGVKKGSFRVGGDDQYLEVRPDPDHEGQYLITLQAGNITLTSGSDTSFRQGTYIYDKVDPNKRLALTSIGIIAQQNISDNPSVEVWENMAEVRTDELGNLIITNSDTPPTIGVKVTGDVYHFDDIEHPLNAESGTNTQNITGEGSSISTEGLDSIIKPISSGRCFGGTLEKDISSFTGTVVYFSKSNITHINDKYVYSDGTVTDDVQSGYNNLMQESYDSGTVGSYLGLNATQIANGIFVEE